MPAVLLVLFASVFGGGPTRSVAGRAIATDAYFTAGIAAYSIMLIGVSTP